jgi:hypothetical protein
MPGDAKTLAPPAPVGRRAAALEQAFGKRNLISAGFIDDFARIVEEDRVPANGAKGAARALTRRPAMRSSTTGDLWPQASDRTTVHVGVFESYVEKPR